MQEKNNKVIDKENNDKKPFVLSDKWKAVILAFVLVAFFVIVIFSPAFSVKEINIQDSEYYTEEELLESFSQFKGKNGNILLINNTKFSQASGIFNRHLTVVEEQMLFDYPLIKNINIKYSAPGTINVTLSDRKPVMMVDYFGTFLYVDTQGYVLAVNSDGIDNNLPIVQGIDIDTYKVGTPLTLETNKKIDAAIKLCMVISELSMNDYIDIIDISNYNNIRMFCAPSLAIEFGSLENLKVRLSILKSVFDTGKDGYSNGTIDMTGGNTPVFKEKITE